MNTTQGSPRRQPDRAYRAASANSRQVSASLNLLEASSPVRSPAKQDAFAIHWLFSSDASARLGSQGRTRAEQVSKSQRRGNSQTRPAAPGGDRQWIGDDGGESLSAPWVSERSASPAIFNPNRSRGPKYKGQKPVADASAEGVTLSVGEKPSPNSNSPRSAPETQGPTGRLVVPNNVSPTQRDGQPIFAPQSSLSNFAGRKISVGA